MLEALSVLIVVVVATAVVLAVRRAARGAGCAPGPLTFGAAGVLSVWLAAMLVLARAGVFHEFEARPPRLLLAVATAVVLLSIATRSPLGRRLRAVSPRWFPIALQTMRGPIELGLGALYAAGRLPVHLTFHGRNFDILVGLSAPIVAFALARGWVGRRVVIAWNVLSLGLLANIVGMAITTFPGPLHRPWPGISNAVLAEPPFVWLPTFLVPLALFGHVWSLSSDERVREHAGAAERLEEPDADRVREVQ